jgi:hypothetical protein
MRSAVVSAREHFGAEHRCTAFTTDDVDTTADNDVFGAAICPGCEKRNPLTGDPPAFHGQVVRCLGCPRVMVLDGASLAAFETEVAGDAA